MRTLAVLVTALFLAQLSFAARPFLQKRRTVPKAESSTVKQKSAESITAETQANKKEVAKEKSRNLRKSAKKKRSSSRIQLAQKKEAGAQIISSRNKVEIKSASTGRWSKAGNKSNLGKDDSIRTGSRSIARVKLNDGSKILLMQNSEAEMENLSSVQKAIKLIRGRVRAVVKRLKTSRSFKIKTPIGVASVRGTDFEVGYVEGSEEMEVEVKSGSVAVAKLGDLANEVILQPGDTLKFNLKGEIGDPIQTGAIPLNRQDVRGEVVISSVKNNVVSMAAEEARNADYQLGKTMIDVDGQRVRVEEYITRPTTKKFKLVALNERSNRFDYFTYTGTFNTDLPVDLKTALSEVGGKLGSTQPTYWLTAYEMYMSNTRDYIKDTGTGGHLVKIDLNEAGDTYTLTGSDGSTVDVAVAALQNDGTYKVYNPIKDVFSYVNADDLTEAKKLSVNDAGTYRNMTGGDRYWKTRFDTNTFYINTTLKSSYSLNLNHADNVTQLLVLDDHGAYGNNCGTSGTESCKPITTVSEFPDGTGTLHNKLSLYYSDGSSLVFDNYIIDDEGNVASTSAFSGISGSAEYQSELNNWNYQQKITASEMSDSINLVIDPRIGTMSGLIQ
jgi:hypothetical protein